MVSIIENKVAEKLAALREIYLGTDNAKRITDTEAALRRNIKKVQLAERSEVKEIVAEAVKAVQDISFILANDETLTTEQRNALFAEKRVHRFWLDRIDGTRAAEAIRIIEQTVDSFAPGKK